MFIHRIEDITGTGPYGANNPWRLDLQEAHSSDGPEEDRQTPYQDPLLRMWQGATPWRELQKYYFGCVSLKDLTWWFKTFLPRLDRTGFFVSTYEIEGGNEEEGVRYDEANLPFILRGTFQVAFLRKNATRVSTRSIASLGSTSLVISNWINDACMI